MRCSRSWHLSAFLTDFQLGYSLPVGESNEDYIWALLRIFDARERAVPLLRCELNAT
jgi:hypothetical protein